MLKGVRLAIILIKFFYQNLSKSKINFYLKKEKEIKKMTKIKI